MEIALIILYCMILIIHALSLFLNVTVILTDGSAPVIKRVMSLIASVTFSAYIPSNAIVILLLVGLFDDSYRTVIVILDVIAAFIYLLLFTNLNATRLSLVLKGITPDLFVIITRLVVVKLIVEVVLGFSGIVLCTLWTNYYMHFFLGLLLDVTSSIGLVYFNLYLRGLVKARIIHPELELPNVVTSDSNAIKFENAKTEIKQMVRFTLFIIIFYNAMQLPLWILFNDGSFTSALIIILPQKLLFGMGPLRLAMEHRAMARRASTQELSRSRQYNV